MTELFPVPGSRLKQTPGSLSEGEQQMLALSRAYVMRPRVVVRDEVTQPCRKLDPELTVGDLLTRHPQGFRLVSIDRYTAMDAIVLAFVVLRCRQ